MREWIRGNPFFIVKGFLKSLSFSLFKKRRITSCCFLSWPFLRILLCFLLRDTLNEKSYRQNEKKPVRNCINENEKRAPAKGAFLFFRGFYPMFVVVWGVLEQIFCFPSGALFYCLVAKNLPQVYPDRLEYPKKATESVGKDNPFLRAYAFYLYVD